MRVLIAGGTGLLGKVVVARLAAGGTPVRVLTRESARAKPLESDLVEIVEGDVRDRASLRPALAGVSTVVSAFHGLTDPKSSPELTDRQGNVNLVDESRAAGAQHFVLVSAMGTRPDHPLGLHRAKYAAEQHLKASGLAWTILKPPAFAEFWAAMVGRPLIETGKTRIFGRGDNRMNYVSVHDVAIAIERAITDPALSGAELEVGGPDNVSFNELVAMFERAAGRRGQVSHVPRPMLRVMAVAMRPFNPMMARMVAAAIVNDTLDMSWDGTATRQRYAWLPQTPLSQVVADLARVAPAPTPGGGP